MSEDAVRTRLKRGRRFGWLYEPMVTTGPKYLTCPSFCTLSQLGAEVPRSTVADADTQYYNS
jgi:hypothetical protein